MPRLPVRLNTPIRPTITLNHVIHGLYVYICNALAHGARCQAQPLIEWLTSVPIRASASSASILGCLKAPGTCKLDLYSYARKKKIERPKTIGADMSRRSSASSNQTLNHQAVFSSWMLFPVKRSTKHPLKWTLLYQNKPPCKGLTIMLKASYCMQSIICQQLVKHLFLT